MTMKAADRIISSLSIGPRTLRQIVDEANVQTRTASNALKILCSRGRVRRRRCLEDARVRLYILVSQPGPTGIEHQFDVQRAMGQEKAE